MAEPKHTLWCVHAIGPDELHPANSFAEAARAAHRMNEFYLNKNPPEADEYVLLWFNVIEWPYDAEAHSLYIAGRAFDSIFVEASNA